MYPITKFFLPLCIPNLSRMMNPPNLHSSIFCMQHYAGVLMQTVPKVGLPIAFHVLIVTTSTDPNGPQNAEAWEKIYLACRP